MLADLPQPDAVPDESTVVLVEPVEAQWAVGSLGVAYDGTKTGSWSRPTSSSRPTRRATRRPASSRRRRACASREAQVLAFVATAERLMEGGRPPCPLCGRPMNPDGHICPRTNGHAIN